MSESPTWGEVKRAVEAILLRNLALDLERLASIGIKAVTIVARLPQHGDPLGAGFTISIARSLELTDLQADLLLASAAAFNPQVKFLVERMEAGKCVLGPAKYLHAADFNRADAEFADTARRLLEPEGATDGAQDSDSGRPAPDGRHL